MTVKKKKDWFKLKRYAHIGTPLKASDRYKWIESYIKNPTIIAKHSFLPFIHKKSKVRKFRKEYCENTGDVIKTETKNGLKVLRHPKSKDRELYYAAHLDSLVFSYYSFILSELYETKIKEHDLSQNITAYRSIPIDLLKPEGPNKCNIDFANDIFKAILNFKEEEFVVMAFDISGFFDNLDHVQLRNVWMGLLNDDRLPKDHFNVYKNITRFSYVEQVDLFEMFKDQLIVERNKDFSTSKEHKKKSIKKLRHIRNQHTIAFCEKNDFIKMKSKLVRKRYVIDSKTGERNWLKKGIPQGSPISSVLANSYLLEFDKEVAAKCKEVNALYRRYSDDMVVVCSKSDKDEISDLIYSQIKEYKLEIRKDKTQIFQFKKNGDRLICGQEFLSSVNWNKNFVYLGFEFDGKHVTLKSGSLSGYYRKMNRGVNRAHHFASKKGSKTKGEFFKQRILKKYTYKGAKRYRKWIWSDKTKSFERSDYYNWGNFLSYAYKADKSMVNSKIGSQVKGHWKNIDKLINHAKEE